MSMKFPKAAQYLMKYGYDPSIVCVDGIYSDGFISAFKPREGMGKRADGRVIGSRDAKAYVHAWTRDSKVQGFSYSTLSLLALEDASARGDYAYRPRGSSRHSGETFA